MNTVMNPEATQTELPSLIDIHYRLAQHEALYSEHQKDIKRRLDRIERVIMGATAVLLTGMGSLVFAV